MIGYPISRAFSAREVGTSVIKNQEVLPTGAVLQAKGGISRELLRVPAAFLLTLPHENDTVLSHEREARLVKSHVPSGLRPLSNNYACLRFHPVGSRLAHLTLSQYNAQSSRCPRYRHRHLRRLHRPWHCRRHVLRRRAHLSERN